MSADFPPKFKSQRDLETDNEKLRRKIERLEYRNSRLKRKVKKLKKQVEVQSVIAVSHGEVSSEDSYYVARPEPMHAELGI